MKSSLLIVELEGEKTFTLVSSELQEVKEGGMKTYRGGL
jgi:hypothetical protein